MSAARLIPWVLHEFIEYLAGVFLILAPFLFFGDVADVLDTAAFPLFVGVGVAIVAVQLFTRGKAGIAELLPVRVHATLDYLIALFLIISPFLFGLTDADQPAALLIPILLGVAHLVITLLTRFPLEEAAPVAAAEGTVSSADSASSAAASPGQAGATSGSSSGSASSGSSPAGSPSATGSASTTDSAGSGDAGSTQKLGGSGGDTERTSGSQDSPGGDRPGGERSDGDTTAKRSWRRSSKRSEPPA